MGEVSQENQDVSMQEAVLPKVEIVRLADSLGYGEGSISHQDRIGEVGPDTLKAVEAAIQSHEILVPISSDKSGKPIIDDGCPDGRSWKRIFEGQNQRYKSLNRPKVFGGGLVMGVAGAVANDETNGLTLNELFSRTRQVFKNGLINYGAHTDDHASGSKSGCGAIDNAPTIISNAVKYRDEIYATLKVLDLDLPQIDSIFKNFADYSRQVEGQTYEGRQVIQEATEDGKVVKELAGPHLEMYIILNTVNGFTVDQEKIRQLSDSKAQVFVVDVWRLEELADSMYEEQDARNKAFIGGIVYSLSTAATLTKGDLPVYLIKPAA